MSKLPFKYLSILTIFVVIMVIFSCSSDKKPRQSTQDLLDSNDINAIRVKRDQIKLQADSLMILYQSLHEKVMQADSERAGYKLVKSRELKDTLYQHFIQIQANIETKQDVNISPEFSGVIRLSVSEGQYINRGALIGVIDDGGLRSQLNQAEIQVDQARSQVQQMQIQAELAKVTFQKQSSLWNQKIGSEIQYLQAKTNYESAEKQVKIAKQQVSAAQKGVSGIQAQLRKTNLRAPFSGIVDQIITKSGQVVGPGVPVVRLVNPSLLKIKAEVPENYISNIQIGTKAMVKIPAIDKEIQTKVNLVSASINPNNRTFTIEVPISNKNGDVKPNQNAEIHLNDYTNINAIIIPENVIQYDSQNAYVYVVEKLKNQTGIAKKVILETGLESNANVEVLSGLESGDILITEGANKIQEGDKIKITS